MRQDSWMKADIFRRIPKDLTEATVSGAIVSILCLVVMVLLFTGEVISYAFPRTHSDMMMARGRGDERIKVFLDIELHRLPCVFLSVDIADILRNHEVDSSQNLRKIPLSSSGEEIARKTDLPSVDLTEGCRLTGHILVTKVPGNFHISVHSQYDAARRSFPEGILLDHTIRLLSFEPLAATSAYRHAERGSRPLEGLSAKSAGPSSYQYFLDVVPTLYDGAFTTTHTYQYTVAQKNTPMRRGSMGEVRFNYQLAPIAVKYSSARVSFTHFLTYICAIIGGVYTVAGLLSRFVHNSAVQVQKRFLGKGD